jgi:hypothetical protein
MSRVPDAMLEAEPTQAHFLPPLPWKHSFTACHKGGRLVNGTGFLLRKTSFRKSAIPDSECVFLYSHLSNQLNNATGLLDLLLRQSAHPPGADDQRDLGQTALAEDLGVAQGQEVEDGNGVLLLASDVGVTGLDGDERPQLVEVDDGLPEVVLLLVEVSHTDLSEVTGVVLVHVGTVVVLTTGKTTTTGVLAVLTDTTVTGRDVAAVLAGLRESGRHGDCGW